MKMIPEADCLARIPIIRIKVYVPVTLDGETFLLQCFRNAGGEPELFIDVETPKPEFKYMKTKELHLGFRGKFVLEPLFKSNCSKNRIDANISLEEIMPFATAILNAAKPKKQLEKS